MSVSVPRLLAAGIVAAVVLFAQPAGAGQRCERATAKRLQTLADTARRCMAACREQASVLASCSAAAPEGELARCLARAKRRARHGIRRACGRVEPPLDDVVRGALADDHPAFCGDGVVTEPEHCDEAAPSSCPEGQQCTACLYCHTVCGDGLVVEGETCDPETSPSSCPAGERCVGCLACGRDVPLVSADEDISPCTDGVGDRWTFDVEAGTVVTISADTVDAASAAKLAFEGTCPQYGFRRAVGFPCTFTPPNDPNPGYGCPLLTFVASATGSCALTVGVFDRLDVGDGKGCADPDVARYRLSVGGTALTLSGDDVPPGLVIR